MIFFLSTNEPARAEYACFSLLAILVTSSTTEPTRLALGSKTSGYSVWLMTVLFRFRSLSRLRGDILVCAECKLEAAEQQ